MTKTLKAIKGDKYRSKLIQNLAFGSYNKRFKNVTSENSWVCGNQKTIEAYDKDELCGFIFTLNGFQNLFTLIFAISKIKDMEYIEKISRFS